MPTATPVAPDFVFDGSVSDIAADGEHTYVAGSFATQRKPTGGAIVTSASGDGLPDAAALPKVAGTVSASVADGNGGWYVGGSFTAVGSAKRTNLAHVRADGSVDPTFDVALDGPISQLDRAGSTLFLGGRFTKVAGENRQAVAAVSTSTGAATAFAPELSTGYEFTSPYVNAILVDGDTVYLGGEFVTVGGQPSRRVAAVSALTGVPTAFSADIRRGINEYDGSVLALAKSGDTLFVGGNFNKVNGTTRKSLAGLDATTGATTAFDSTVVGPYDSVDTVHDRVSSLDLHDGKLYLGGLFVSVGGQPRSRVAAVDPASGAVSNWNPSIPGNTGYHAVTRIAATDSTVYVAGAFRQVGGQERVGVAAVSASTGGLLPWNPQIGRTDVGEWNDITGPVATVTPSGDRILVGGAFSGAGLPTSTRRAIVRLRADGSIDPSWTPAEGPKSIARVAVGPDTVYAYDDTTYPGTIRAYDRSTGATTTAPAGEIPPSVGDMLVVGDRLVVAASYTSGRRIGAYDTATGALNAWNPTIAGSLAAVSRLEATGDTLYTTGSFDTVGGQARKGFAAFDLGSFDLTPLAPSTTFGSTFELARDGNVLYDGQKAIDRLTGEPLPWAPDRRIYRVAVGTDGLYGLAGSNVAFRSDLVHVDKTSGATTALGAAPFGLSSSTFAEGHRLVVGNGHLLVGGDAGSVAIGETVTGPFGRLALGGGEPEPEPEPPTNSASPSAEGSAALGTALTCHPGTWTGAPTYAYQWLRDGSEIANETSRDHVVTIADIGHSLACRVTATNAGGSAIATSSVIAAHDPTPQMPVPTPPTETTTAPPAQVPAPPTSNAPPTQNPAPPTTASAPGPTKPPPAGAPKVTVPGKLAARALRKGVALRLAGLKAGSRVVVEIRVGTKRLASKTLTASVKGAASGRAKWSGASTKRIRKAREFTLRIRAVRTDGKQVTITRTVRVT